MSQSAKQQAAELAREGRRLKAMELKLEGKTFRHIADQLGVSVGTAHGDVQACLLELVEMRQDTTEEYVELETERLEADRDDLNSLLGALAPDISQGCHGAIDKAIKIINQRVKVSESIRKLRGLDAPQRNQHTIATVSPADAAEEINDAFGLDVVEVVEVDDEQEDATD